MKPAKSKLPRKEYSVEFKKEALAYWKSSGKTAAAVCEELGITSHSLLFAWNHSFSSAPPGGEGGAEEKSHAELLAEIKALRRENERLRLHREILKKTLGIVAEPPSMLIDKSTP